MNKLLKLPIGILVLVVALAVVTGIIIDRGRENTDVIQPFDNLAIARPLGCWTGNVDCRLVRVIKDNANRSLLAWDVLVLRPNAELIEFTVNEDVELCFVHPSSVIAKLCETGTSVTVSLEKTDVHP